MKGLKIIGIAIVLGIFALIATFGTLKIQTSIDETHAATIGVIKHYGFPFRCVSTAPGLAWPDWNGRNLLLNIFSWWIVPIGIWILASTVKNKKKDGSNQNLERTR